VHKFLTRTASNEAVAHCATDGRGFMTENYSMSRSASVHRKTVETDIELNLNLDGGGTAEIATGVGFFDHMLTLLGKHAAMDLTVRARGDLHVDQHHTVEDVGICLGQAVREALGDKAGIRRYGHFTLPMEETLVTAAVDLGGRAFLVFKAEFPSHRIGEFESELVAEFWQAFAANALCNLHIVVHHGRNSHHIAEAIFKAVARALRNAVEEDPRVRGIPSTKGTL
jgi:imidazoleglycerol-phosphate dehydratase